MALRVFSRIPKTNTHHLLRLPTLRPQLLRCLSDFSGSTWSLFKLQPYHLSILRHPFHEETILERFGFSSSASPQATEKERSQAGDHDNTSSNVFEPVQETSEAGLRNESTEVNDDSTAPEQPNTAGSSFNSEQIESQSSKKKRRRITKRTAFSESDTEPEVSVEELLAEKDSMLKSKQKMIEQLQERVIRSNAEMEGVLRRTKREVENSKKYGIQNFAKSLLDVADNLGRASSVVKENFLKIDQASNNEGMTLLKSLLEGVEMTEKQLTEVFRQFKIHKYESLNESFDPNRHNAVFEIPDESKPPGTVAAVLKAGYMIHDRVLRPAEVGVTRKKSATDEN